MAPEQTGRMNGASVGCGRGHHDGNASLEVLAPPWRLPYEPIEFLYSLVGIPSIQNT
jgi:hypothetical protein